MSAFKILISVSLQTLSLISLNSGETVKTYNVSTSKYGTGSEEGSMKTPLGNLMVDTKIGSGAPIYTIFESRIPNSIWDGAPSDSDFVLTRILWLAGLDPSNSNTKSRYIYIHGTNQENLIGTPASHGCIRMINNDVIELFDIVEEGTRILIN